MKRVNSNTVIAIGAVVVSVYALYVSIQEMRVIREEHEAMGYPQVWVDEN